MSVNNCLVIIMHWVYTYINKSTKLNNTTHINILIKSDKLNC